MTYDQTIIWGYLRPDVHNSAPLPFDNGREARIQSTGPEYQGVVAPWNYYNFQLEIN